MFFFEGSSCPVCGKTFEPSDDVVACPVCGAPHHRECYKEKNACAFEDRHAEGWVWEREKETPGAEGGGEPVVCPECGTLNPAGRLYCQSCTKPLFGDVAGTKSEQEDAERARPQAQSDIPGFYGVGPEFSNCSDGELIDGVPAGDLKRFLGYSWYMYLPMFVDLARGVKKIAFNLLAVFLHGMWFISRKMYVLGGGILAGMLGIFALQAVCYDTVQPFYDRMLAGDSTAALELVQAHPVMMLLLFGTTLVRYAVYILSGFFANRLYKKHCVDSVKKINATSLSAEQFNRRLENEGGQAMIPFLISAGIYFGAQYLIQTRLM